MPWTEVSCVMSLHCPPLLVRSILSKLGTVPKLDTTFSQIPLEFQQTVPQVGYLAGEMQKMRW